jgi:hypothetical protein
MLLYIPIHRYTAVGNSGKGGSLGFLANSFEGGTWGCEKIRGVVFYCIFMWKFFKNLYRGYMGCPPSPLSPLPCVQLCANILMNPSDAKLRSDVKLLCLYHNLTSKIYLAVVD